MEQQYQLALAALYHVHIGQSTAIGQLYEQSRDKAADEPHYGLEARPAGNSKFTEHEYTSSRSNDMTGGRSGAAAFCPPARNFNKSQNTFHNNTRLQVLQAEGGAGAIKNLPLF